MVYSWNGVRVFDKKLFSLAPGSMRYIVTAVFWMWLGLIGDILLIYSFAELIASLFAGNAPEIMQTLYFVIAAAVLKALSSFMSTEAKFMASCNVKRQLRERLYRKLLRLGPAYMRQASTAEVVQMSVDGTEQLESYFGQYLPQLVYALVAPLTLFEVIAPIHLWAAIVLLVFVPLIPVVIGMVQGIARKLLGKYLDQYVTLGDSFLENLQGLTTLKIYEADAARHAAMNDEAQRFREITMKVLRMQLNSIIVMDIVALGGAAAGIITCLSAVANGSVTLRDFIFVALLSSSFFIPMRQLGSFFHVAMNGMASSKKIFRLLDLPEPAEKTQLVSANATFELAGLSYSYDGEHTVLKGIDITLPETGLVGIVGASGSGKSTIAYLLSGGDDEYAGDLTLGGVQIRDIDRASLRSCITYVGLGAYLFNGSVRENLLIANPKASDQELWEVLDRCALGDFLRAEDGLDTELLEEAANLSGGQRQRLALARALLHDTPVFVLDEATSNIDVESEEAIMSVVSDLAKTHAVICISHRLANVVDAERIFVLESGCVVGQGSHARLLEACPQYAALWGTQLELESYRAKGGAKHGE